MKLQWLHTICSNGQHNAFTGLTFFKGRYFLAFRQATHHGWSEGVGPSYGRQILMTSADGERWTPHRETLFPPPPPLPPGTPIDARDNYFLNLGEELRLYSYAHAPFLPEEDRFMIPSYSTVQTTRDGDTWSEPRPIQSGVIMWKPIFWRDRFWCAGYHHHASLRSVVDLYQSEDGFDWRPGSRIAPGNESFLHPVGDDCLRVFVRTQVEPHHMEIWDGQAPFTTWQRVAMIPTVIQAPHVIDVHGRRLLLGRDVPATGPSSASAPPSLRRTKIWELRDNAATEVLELPSLGDTSYVGTVVRPDGLLLVSYYSQHEQEPDARPEMRGGNDKPADVFVAGVAVS